MTKMKCNRWKSVILIAVSMTAVAQTPDDLDDGELLEFLGEFGVDDEWLDPMQVEKWSEGHADTATDTDFNYRKPLQDQQMNDRANSLDNIDRSRWLMLDDTHETDEPEDESDEQN